MTSIIFFFKFRESYEVDDIQALDDNLLSMIFSPVLLAVQIMQDSDDYLGCCCCIDYSVLMYRDEILL